MGFSLNVVDKPKNEGKIFVEPRCTVLLTPETTSPGTPATEACTISLTWKALALVMGFCLLIVVILSVILLSRRTDVPVPDIANLPQIPIGNDGILPQSVLRDSITAGAALFPQIPVSGSDGMSTKLRFVERAEWGAQPPTEVMDKLHLPVPYVIISHTMTDFCETQSECTFRTRFAQTFHMESRNWSDIAYNFLIGGDGFAYVGRSWEYVGAHSYGYNTKSIGISFIGNFNKVTPPEHQLLAAQQLIQFGVEHGKIAPDYKLLGHRQISKTRSPGDALYSVIQTWPHWSPIP